MVAFIITYAKYVYFTQGWLINRSTISLISFSRNIIPIALGLRFVFVATLNAPVFKFLQQKTKSYMIENVRENACAPISAAA